MWGVHNESMVNTRGWCTLNQLLNMQTICLKNKCYANYCTSSNNPPKKCEGRDSNPRKPSLLDLKSSAFDLAGQSSHIV